MSKKQLLIPSCLLAAALCASVVLAQTASTRPAGQGEGANAFTMFSGGDNFLGVYTEPVTRENMSRYGLSGEPRGVAVARVSEGSPAAKAGLQKDDVIVRFDGEAVGSARKLSRLIEESAPEHAARLTIARGGTEREVAVTLGRRETGRVMEGLKFDNGELFRLKGGEWQKQTEEEARRQREEWKQRAEELRKGLENVPRGGFGGNFANGLGTGGRRIGVTTTPLTDQLADYFGVGREGGVLITSVRENSPAARGGLKAGDVITEVDGERVKGAGELTRAVSRKDAGEVSLTVVRERSRRTLRVTPEKAQAQTWTIPEGLFKAPEGVIALPGALMNGASTIPLAAPFIVAPRVRALPATRALPRHAPNAPVVVRPTGAAAPARV